MLSTFHLKLFMANYNTSGSKIINYEENYITSSRGIKLFTCQWIPAFRDPKALIFLCHGYGFDCSFTFKGIGIRFAEAGYAVYGMDYEGHGKSSGLQGYIRSFDGLVDDCSEYFISICEKMENRKNKFLFGESMGAMVILLLHRKNPTYWDGAVLVAPMCKIAEELKPNPVARYIIRKLCKIIPTWKLIPVRRDLLDAAIKLPEWREQIKNNPYCYKGKPRLQTGHELMRVSLDLEKYLYQISIPFLIVHGEDDTITDPAMSQSLYVTAASKDKSFRLYPKMWHAIVTGEPQENIDMVLTDVITWLDIRSVPRDYKTELEAKCMNDTHATTKQSKYADDVVHFSSDYTMEDKKLL